MPDYDKTISDFMKQFEDETIEEPVSSPAQTEINEPVQKTDTIPETTDLQQNQDIQSPAVQSNYPANNPQFCKAVFTLNALNGNSNCIRKYVQIPDYPIYAQIIPDVNCNLYLCIPNQQTGQYDYIGYIAHEPPDEYVVYQNYQKVGTLYYHPFEESVWKFVPSGTVMPCQNQNNQYPTPNAQQPKYIFNNVPPEQANSVIRTITENQPQNPIEVNFSSPAVKTFMTADELKNIIDITPK